MDMLLKPLVPKRKITIRGQDFTLQDLYKAAPGGRELDVLIFDLKRGRWEMTPSLVGCEALADQCTETVIEILQNKCIECVPAWVRKGAAMRAAAAGILRSSLYDKEHHTSLDNPATLQFLVFDDGILFDRDTMKTCRTTPSMPISHHMGIKFPTKEFHELNQKYGSKLNAVFNAIKQVEAMQGSGYKREKVFTPSMCDFLKLLSKEIEALGVLFTCHENWEVV